MNCLKMARHNSTNELFKNGKTLRLFVCGNFVCKTIISGSERMSLVGKMMSEIEIKAPADKYYKLFKHQLDEVPNITPIVQNVEVHEGDWDTHGHGSIKIWNYTVDGKAEVFKEQVEFDDEKLAVTLVGLEGDVFEHYKKFKTTYQVVPKGPEHSFAVHTIEYEKLDDGSPYPFKYLELMNNVAKDIESHLE